MELLAALLLFATIAAAFIFVGSRYWVRPKAAIERVTEGSPGSSVRGRVHPGAAFRGLMGRLGTVLPASARDASLVERRLIRAGFRGSGALKTFYGSKVFLAVLLPVLTLAIGPQAGLPEENRMLEVALAVAAGFLGPNEFVRMSGRCRQRQIRRALPNALDLMVVCVESGLGLDQAIMQTAKELRRAHPEISQELAQVNFELKAGKRRVEALRNLAERCAVAELKKLVAVLVQADRFGTGIAQTLREHSDYMRVQARQVAEEKAAKLGVKLIFPIFFCILPSLFVVTVGPVFVRISRELLPMMRNM
jgi:tight adherence protein C